MTPSSGVSTGSQLASLTHGCDILVATPGRLMDFVGQGKIGFHMVKYLVLDEADRMLDMGFMPDVKKIVGDPNMPPKGDRVTLMFSATFPTIIRKVADQFLHRYIFLTVGVVGGACTDVAQKFYQVTLVLASGTSSSSLSKCRWPKRTRRTV
jgi:superfamily II DNA/RNA helicase